MWIVMRYLCTDSQQDTENQIKWKKSTVYAAKNSQDFCPNFVQEFGLRSRCLLYGCTLLTFYTLVETN